MISSNVILSYGFFFSIPVIKSTKSLLRNLFSSNTRSFFIAYISHSISLKEKKGIDSLKNVYRQIPSDHVSKGNGS